MRPFGWAGGDHVISMDTAVRDDREGGACCSGAKNKNKFY